MPKLRLLSIDPSSRSLGWAVMTSDGREDSGSVRGKSLIAVMNKLDSVIGCYGEGDFDRVVIEGQEYHQGARGHASLVRGDVFMCAQAAGAAAMLLWYRFRVEPEFILPSVWKGNLPAEVVVQRVEGCFKNMEKFDEDEAHAIGLGLYVLRKFDALG